MAKTRVLIVDDSAAVRQVLTEVINADPRLEVMATAADPVQAVARIRKERPDVITLDVEMPQMDGVTFLRRLMSQHPIPVVMCSTLMEENSTALLDALSAGAVDAIQKPRLNAVTYLEETSRKICDAIHAAAKARPRARNSQNLVEKRHTADEVLPPPGRPSRAGPSNWIIAIGASTGGTEALSVLLQGLPAEMPPIVIVQHMPGAFTGAFAKRLDANCALTVREATDGVPLVPGTVLIAPGGIHLLVTRRGNRHQVELRDGPPVARHKPSVDVLFRSVARAAGAHAMGVILTGMGDDGARGLRELRDAGGRSIGQNEATSVVYGMPKAAFAAGAVEVQLPLDRIATHLASMRNTR